MWVNQMQEAFIKGAVDRSKTIAMPADAKLLDKVIRVAERQRPRDPQPSIQLSYRTAQRLKASGVI